jgi:biotin transport system substrate-specific component
MVYASLMAALIAAGAYLAIPIGPVPIVLQNLFVFLAGLLLGARWGLACIGIYLLAGICGLPVFAGGTGGIGRLVGPTGGYLLGYIPAIAAIGWLSAKGKHKTVGDYLALIIGASLVYAFGVTWLQVVTGMPWEKTLMVGMVPFLPGDVIKIIVAVPMARVLRPYLKATRQPVPAAS